MVATPIQAAASTTPEWRRDSQEKGEHDATDNASSVNTLAAFLMESSPSRPSLAKSQHAPIEGLLMRQHGEEDSTSIEALNRFIYEAGNIYHGGKRLTANEEIQLRDAADHVGLSMAVVDALVKQTSDSNAVINYCMASNDAFARKINDDAHLSRMFEEESLVSGDGGESTKFDLMDSFWRVFLLKVIQQFLKEHDMELRDVLEKSSLTSRLYEEAVGNAARKTESYKEFVPHLMDRDYTQERKQVSIPEFEVRAARKKAAAMMGFAPHEPLYTDFGPNFQSDTDSRDDELSIQVCRYLPDDDRSETRTPAASTPAVSTPSESKYTYQQDDSGRQSDVELGIRSVNGRLDQPTDKRAILRENEENKDRRGDQPVSAVKRGLALFENSASNVKYTPNSKCCISQPNQVKSASKRLEAAFQAANLSEVKSKPVQSENRLKPVSKTLDERALCERTNHVHANSTPSQPVRMETLTLTTSGSDSTFSVPIHTERRSGRLQGNKTESTPNPQTALAAKQPERFQKSSEENSTSGKSSRKSSVGSKVRAAMKIFNTPINVEPIEMRKQHTIGFVRRAGGSDNGEYATTCESTCAEEISTRPDAQKSAGGSSVDVDPAAEQCGIDNGVANTSVAFETWVNVYDESSADIPSLAERGRAGSLHEKPDLISLNPSLEEIETIFSSFTQSSGSSEETDGDVARFNAHALHRRQSTQNARRNQRRKFPDGDRPQRVRGESELVAGDPREHNSSRDTVDRQTKRTCSDESDGGGVISQSPELESDVNMEREDERENAKDQDDNCFAPWRDKVDTAAMGHVATVRQQGQDRSQALYHRRQAILPRKESSDKKLLGARVGAATPSGQEKEKRKAPAKPDYPGIKQFPGNREFSDAATPTAATVIANAISLTEVLPPFEETKKSSHEENIKGENNLSDVFVQSNSSGDSGFPSDEAHSDNDAGPPDQLKNYASLHTSTKPSSKKRDKTDFSEEVRYLSEEPSSKNLPRTQSQLNNVNSFRSSPKPSRDGWAKGKSSEEEEFPSNEPVSENDAGATRSDFKKSRPLRSSPKPSNASDGWVQFAQDVKNDFESRRDDNRSDIAPSDGGVWEKFGLETRNFETSKGRTVHNSDSTSTEESSQYSHDDHNLVNDTDKGSDNKIQGHSDVKVSQRVNAWGKQSTPVAPEGDDPVTNFRTQIATSLFEGPTGVVVGPKNKKIRGHHSPQRKVNVNQRIDMWSNREEMVVSRKNEAVNKANGDSVDKYDMVGCKEGIEDGNSTSRISHSQTKWPQKFHPEKQSVEMRGYWKAYNQLHGSTKEKLLSNRTQKPITNPASSSDDWTQGDNDTIKRQRTVDYSQSKSPESNASDFNALNPLHGGEEVWSHGSDYIGLNHYEAGLTESMSSESDFNAMNYYQAPQGSRNRSDEPQGRDIQSDKDRPHPKHANFNGHQRVSQKNTIAVDEFRQRNDFLLDSDRSTVLTQPLPPNHVVDTVKDFRQRHVNDPRDRPIPIDKAVSQNNGFGTGATFRQRNFPSSLESYSEYLANEQHIIQQGNHAASHIGFSAVNVDLEAPDIAWTMFDQTPRKWNPRGEPLEPSAMRSSGQNTMESAIQMKSEEADFQALNTFIDTHQPDHIGGSQHGLKTNLEGFPSLAEKRSFQSGIIRVDTGQRDEPYGFATKKQPTPREDKTMGASPPNSRYAPLQAALQSMSNSSDYDEEEIRMAAQQSGIPQSVVDVVFAQAKNMHHAARGAEEMGLDETGLPPSHRSWDNDQAVEDRQNQLPPAHYFGRSEPLVGRDPTPRWTQPRTPAESVHSDKVPEGATAEELRLLNKFIEVAATNFDGKKLSEDSEVRVRVAALKIGLSQMLVDQLLEQAKANNSKIPHSTRNRVHDPSSPGTHAGETYYTDYTSRLDGADKIATSPSGATTNPGCQFWESVTQNFSYWTKQPTCGKYDDTSSISSIQSLTHQEATKTTKVNEDKSQDKRQGSAQDTRRGYV
jgi:hypothetical protein